MDQADQSVDVEELPPVLRWLALVLGAGLDLIRARHSRSWSEGRQQGLFDASQVVTPAPRQIVKLTLGHGDLLPAAAGKDHHVLGDGRLPFTPELRTKIREEFARNLPGHQQPTEEQWRVLLASTPLTQVHGGAGTGKSRTLLLRILVLHHYLAIPLDEIQLLTAGREMRLEAAKSLRTVFASFGIAVSEEDTLRVVGTAGSVMAKQARSIPGLEHIATFESLSTTSQETAALTDGRPFDNTLTLHQRAVASECFKELYAQGGRFQDLVHLLWLDSLALAAISVDAPGVSRRATAAWKLAETDVQLTEQVEALWRNASAWPIDGVDAGTHAIDVRGRTFHVHGYCAALNCFVLLGMDDTVPRSLKREPTAPLELYKEVALKKTLFQAYSDAKVVSLDSYDSAQSLASDLKLIGRVAPAVQVKLPGTEEAVDVLDAFHDVAGVVHGLGLDIETVPGRINFLPGDRMSDFIEALAIYSHGLDRYLLNRPAQAVTQNRLCSTLVQPGCEALRYVPMSVLGHCRHLLIDGAEDQPQPVVRWIQAMCAEIRRRDTMRHPDSLTEAPSVMVAGDPQQWIFGTQGSTASLLTEVDAVLPSLVSAVKIGLTLSFRNPVHLITAASNVVQNLGGASQKLLAAASSTDAGAQRISIQGDQPVAFKGLCEQAKAAGESVLVLINDSADRAWVGDAIGSWVKSQSVEQARFIRVRPFHRAKSLEADIVVMVGDPSCDYLPWYMNQIFKLAGCPGSSPLGPADAVGVGEALRLTSLAITRARRACYWFIPAPPGAKRTASQIAPLHAGLFDDQR